MTCPPFATRAALLLLLTLAVGLPFPLTAQSELVIARDAGAEKQYHRAGCPVIRDGKNVLAMTRAEAESRGYKAHRDCDPATAPATPGDGTPSSATGADGRGVVEPSVFVDATGKYYHRADCQKLGKAPRKVLLKDIGKRWPCPTCRPPVRKPTEAPLVPGWRGGRSPG